MDSSIIRTFNQSINNYTNNIQMDNTVLDLENAQDIQESKLNLNSKILALTMTIRDNFSELSKYLDEIPETVNNEINPEITLLNLKTYHETLNTLIIGYLLAHPEGVPEK